MLVHVDLFHLTSNVVLQLVAGIILEKHQGWWRTLLVYFGGVVAGSMAFVDHTSILGSSSGAYALFFSQIPQVTLVSNCLASYLLLCSLISIKIIFSI